VLLHRFPKLQVLDEKDRDGNDLPNESGAEDDDEEGSEYDE
jgi:hypothetical protein